MKTPAKVRRLADPAARERAAHAGIEHARALMSEYATIRREAIRALKAQGGTWEQVGDALDPPVSGPTAYQLANPKERRGDRGPR